MLPRRKLYWQKVLTIEPLTSSTPPSLVSHPAANPMILDLGIPLSLAKDVIHSIWLSDSRPFRERSQRLALVNIEDVRRNLKELLVTGIISVTKSMSLLL